MSADKYEEHFSRQGLQVLYDYLTRREKESGEKIGLTEFTEYESVEKYNEAYGTKCEDWEEVGERTPIIEFIHEDYYDHRDRDKYPILQYRAIVRNHWEEAK